MGKFTKNKTLKFKIIFTIFSAVFAIVVDIIIHYLLHHDGNLTEHGMWVVLFFCGLLTFLFTEWIFFKFEWFYFGEELKEKLTFTDNVFDVINEFSEANFLMKKMMETIKADLNLEAELNISPDHVKKKSLFISKLKYQNFLSSHFKSSGDEKIIRQIPSYYFTHKIWGKFVDESSYYYSLQLLESKESQKVYLPSKNKSENDRKFAQDRLDSELNFLQSKLNGKNKTILKKLFVIEGGEFEKGKLKPGDIKDYLENWKNKFKNCHKVFPIKVIENNKAIGKMKTGPTTDKLDDIGIFGEVYGIQSLNDPASKEFYTDALKIDFYFDEKETEKQKKAFEKLFEDVDSRDLTSVF